MFLHSMYETTLLFFPHLFKPCSYSTMTNTYIAVNISCPDILHIFFPVTSTKWGLELFSFTYYTLICETLSFWQCHNLAIIHFLLVLPTPVQTEPHWCPPAFTDMFTQFRALPPPYSSVRLHVTPHNSNIEIFRLGLIKLTPFRFKEFFSGSAGQVCYFCYSV
jgi:hypothetical protein